MANGTKAWIEKFAEMSHGKTRYWEAGTGYPTILIHGAGWTSGCETWARNIGPLSERLHVYAIDCLNWGLGDVFNQEMSFAYLVDHVREFMDVNGLEKANLVGHSMGGWIVTLFAYESPGRVNKVVNVAGGGTARRPLQNMVEFTVPSDEAITKQIASRFPPNTVDLERIAATFIQKTKDPTQGEAFGNVMKHMTNPMTRARYNTLRRMPFIKAPTLVLWGQNDETNDISMGEETASAIPDAKLIIFEKTGHMLPQQQAERFNREVLAFLLD